jgi:hypothetical protein
MNNRVFFAITYDGVRRAKYTAGSWLVDTVLTGEQVYCIAHAVERPAEIYLGTKKSGVLCSNDEGQSWQSIGLAGIPVKALAVSPHNPQVIYAGTKPSGVHVSTNGGQSWSELVGFQKIRGLRFWRSPAEPPDWRAYVQGLAVSPDDPNHIAAGIEFGALVHSTDGGKTWTNHRKGALRDCHSLIFHRSNGSWVYEAGGGGAAVSCDGGLTWRQPKAGLDRRYGWACAADPERPEIWYLSASGMPTIQAMLRGRFEPPAHIDGQADGAIYRSAGGAPWERLGGGLPYPLTHMAYALLTDPQAPGHLYAGLSSGDVWHSVDYGDHWQQMPFNLGSIHRTLTIYR